MAVTEVFVSAKRCTDEFRTEAVRQVVEHGRPVAEVAERLGITTHNLHLWAHRANLALQPSHKDGRPTLQHSARAKSRFRPSMKRSPLPL